MAEFCLECWNKINGTRDSAWRYVLSWEEDLCEECTQWKRVIIAERHWSQLQRKFAKRFIKRSDVGKETGGLE